MVPKGWEDGRVEDLLNGLESGVSVNGEDRQLLDGEKGVLRVSAVTYGTFDPSAVKVIERQDELDRAKINPKKSQIIISRSNTESLVGASAYINSDYPELFLPDKLWQTIPKPDANMKWLSYVLSSEPVRYTLSNLATGTSGSMKNITKGEFLSLKIAIPPLPEQQKIAKILSTWDKAISTTERLIDNSTQQKKALMQQLLTGKKRLLDNEGKRFDGDWQEVSLEHHMESFINGYAFSASQYKLDGIPIITMGNIGLDGKFNERTHKQNFWQSDSSLDKFLVNKDDLLIAMTDVTPDKNLIGRMTIVTVDKSFYLNQRVGLIKLKPSLDKDFLRYLSNSTDWRKYSVAVSASGVQANMSTKDIKKGKIRLPKILEQQKIATVLTNADKEIELLEQQLADLQQEKKALMQVLLTGKKRVVVDGEVA